MKEEKLLEAIGMVGDDLIQGAKAPKKKLKKNVIKAVAVVLAASVVVAFVWNSSVFVSANYSSKYNRTLGEFAAKTTVELLKDKEENTCYSPVSLFAALALTAEATKGDTRQEIIDTFGVSDIEELEEMYKEMSVTLDVDYEPKQTSNNDGKPMMVETKQAAKITLSNSLWIDESFIDDNSAEVIEQCVNNMKADIFADGSIEPSNVNNWVNEKTNGLIKKIVDVNDDLTIALVNALYYKSSWEFNFSTIRKDFNLEDKGTEKVEFLSVSKKSMRFKEMDKYTVVEVPLQEGDIMLVLPKEGKKLMSILNENSINEVLAMSTNDQMDRGLVNLSFPKFTIEDSYGATLRETLENIGVKSLFDNNEWAISDDLDGSLIQIMQKTKIIVNEKGIEAAAVTAVSSYLSAMFIAGASPL